jgi:GntR family transcriptional regulator, histidine utilization repressor
LTQAPRRSWQQVRTLIHHRILDATYGPGDKLPRDVDLARDLGCARATVQRAMRDLSDAGVIERRRKGGTHVRPDPVTRATLDIPVIRQEVEQSGHAYGYRLISSGLAQTPRHVIDNFALDGACKMLRVQALHLSDRRPYLYEDRWISTQTVPEIASVDLARESANEWLVRNRPYSHGIVQFYATRAGNDFARHLQTAADAALFVVERTTWIKDAPITTVQAVAAPGYQMRSTI